MVLNEIKDAALAVAPYARDAGSVIVSYLIGRAGVAAIKGVEEGTTFADEWRHNHAHTAGLILGAFGLVRTASNPVMGLPGTGLDVAIETIGAAGLGALALGQASRFVRASMVRDNVAAAAAKAAKAGYSFGLLAGPAYDAALALSHRL